MDRFADNTPGLVLMVRPARDRSTAAVRPFFERR